MPDAQASPKTARSHSSLRRFSQLPQEPLAVLSGALLFLALGFLAGFGPHVQAAWQSLLTASSGGGVRAAPAALATVAWTASIAGAVAVVLWSMGRKTRSTRHQGLTVGVAAGATLGLAGVGNVFSAADVQPLWPLLALAGGLAGRMTLLATRRWQIRRQKLNLERMESVLGDANASYLYDLTSELRVNVNAVLGMTDLITEDLADNKKQPELSALRRAAESLQRTLRDVDELALAHSKQLQLNVAELPLLPLIHEQVNQVRREAEHKGLQIQMAVAVDVPRHVMGDAKRLGQVIAHMLNHSVRSTRQGQIQLEIRRHARDKRLMRIVVTDTSMSPISGKLATMAAPFSEAILEKARHGTGIGLSLAQKLAELMGGRLSIRHSTGRGSVMILTAHLPDSDKAAGSTQARSNGDRLPQVSAPVNASLRTASSMQLSLAGDGTKAVLLVEDNPSTSALLNAMLDKDSFRVVTCSNGREALQALSIAPYDIVLMDLHMPELDGMATIKQMRLLEAERRLRRTPVIALGDAPFDMERQRCLDAGFDQHVCKPVRKSKLLESIATLIRPPASAQASSAPVTSTTSQHNVHRDALNLLTEGGVIDVVSAVEGLGGNAAIYLDAIEQLAPALYNWPARFRDTFVRGDIEKARQMALDMQSILDVVRAVPCATALGQMAEALSDSPTDTARQNQALTQLDMHMQALLSALRQTVERLRKGRNDHVGAARKHNSEI